MEKLRIEHQTFSAERAPYHTVDAVIEDCRVAGEEDGESFLKESRNIEVRRCFMDLRYPLWHVEGLYLGESEMTPNCRAALWYDSGVTIERCKMDGIKALRECRGVKLADTEAHSPEFGWRCRDLTAKNCTVVSDYAFLGSERLRFSDLDFTGKYAFQYCRDLVIRGSVLKTKDAFWHAENVRVEDSVIDGEYLGWYSRGLTLVRCKIRGTQPLCYCEGLRLVDCTMEACDLAFEYSDVEAEIRGTVASVKNPRRGKIVADGYGEIVKNDSVYPLFAEILVRKPQN